MYPKHTTENTKTPPYCTEHQKLVRFAYGTYCMESTLTLSDSFLYSTC